MKRRDVNIRLGFTLCSMAMPNFMLKDAFAALPGTVTWGGIYLLEDRPDVMPFTRRALEMSRNDSPTGNSVNKTLLQEIRNTDWSGTGINLRTGLKKEETRYGMVFGLASEKVLAKVYLPSIDSTQYILRSFGYATVYDIVERRIVSCIAVRARYFDNLPGKPDPAQMPTLFFNLLANKDQPGSLTRFMVNEVKDYPFEEKYKGKYFQVDSVIFSDIALKNAASIGISTESYGDDTGFAVTTSFSENLRSPLVPYRKTSAVNREMLSEMKIVSASGDSALNTALQLKPADCGMEITHEGWEFVITASSDTRNQVALVTRLSFRFYDKDSAETFFNQSYYGKQEFVELINFSIERKSRLFMLHETIIDRVFSGISSQDVRGKVFDGEESKTKSQTTFIQADADDWDMFTVENDLVLSRLPRAFGS